MIKPTVGRIVWYYDVNHSEGDQPLAAIITYVWSSNCVNLAVFDGNGIPMKEPPTSVLLLQDDDERPHGRRHCEWMPYGAARERVARKWA